MTPTSTTTDWDAYRSGVSNENGLAAKRRLVPALSNGDAAERAR